MLSVQEFNTVSKIFKVICSSACLPFDWNVTTKEMRVTTSKTKFLISLILAVWRGVYVLVVGPSLFQIYPLWQCGNGSLEQGLFQFLILLCYFCVGFESLVAFLYRVELCCLFNRMAQFNQQKGI
jgi:hypothetical protein